MRLVCDNLSTHSPAAFYETFAPEVAHRLARKVEFRYTPVHGSWLNMVEVEALGLGQAVPRGRRRLPDVGTLCDGRWKRGKRSATDAVPAWIGASRPPTLERSCASSTRRLSLDAGLAAIGE